MKITKVGQSFAAPSGRALSSEFLFKCPGAIAFGLTFGRASAIIGRDQNFTALARSNFDGSLTPRDAVTSRSREGLNAISNGGKSKRQSDLKNGIVAVDKLADATNVQLRKKANVKCA